MKKIFIYIIGLTTIILSAQYAVAQVNTGVSTTLEVETGCIWEGPGATQLRVPDDSVCVITGTKTATKVTVEEDSNSNSIYATLIVGSASVNTDFTVSGVVTIEGIMEIGVDGNPAYNSSFIVSTGSGTTVIKNDGVVTTTYNNNGTNGINSFIINDYVDLGESGVPASYGTLNLLDDSSLNAADEITMYNASILNNTRGTLTLADKLEMNETSSVDNEATLTVNYVSEGILYMNDDSVFENAATGTVNINQNLQMGDAAGSDATFTNYGDLNVYYIANAYSSIFNNETGGTVTYDAISLGINEGSPADHPTQLNNDGDFNVNSVGAVALVAASTLNNSADTFNAVNVYVEGETGTYRSTLNNYAAFNTTNLYFGGTTSYGGTLNNESGGVFAVSGTGDSLDIQNAGKIYNKAGGVFTAAGNIANFTGTGPEAENTALISNASITGAAFSLTSNTAVIKMYGYSKIDNTGGTMNVCGSSCTSTSVITINANNTDIVNGTGGTMNLNGDVTLDYDHYFDSDGAVNIKGISSVAYNLILNTSVVFYTKGATTFSGTYQKVQLNGSTQLNLGSSGSLTSAPATASNSLLELNSTSSITNLGAINFKGTATLKNTSSITNGNDSQAAATFTIDDASSFVNYLQLGSTGSDAPTFTNKKGATVTVDDETSGGNGELRVYYDGSYSNAGTTNTWYLNVGRHSTTDGGTFTNTGDSGFVNVFSTSSSTGTPALDLYKGEIINNSTYLHGNETTSYGSFYIKGYMYMLGTGTGGDAATFTNSGAVYHISTCYMYDYGTLNINTGSTSRWRSSNYMNVYGASGTAGTINVADGGIYGALTTNFYEYSAINNNGSLKIVNLYNGNNVNSNLNLNFNSTSTFNNYATGYIRTYTGTITLNNTPTFNNVGNINYTGGAGETYGYFTVNATNTITNIGIIYTSTAAIQNTTFNNTNIFQCNTLNSGTVDSNSTVFNNTGTVTIGNLYVGTSANRGSTFNNDGTATVTSAYMYSPGIYNNYETKNSAITTLLMYSGTTFHNNGSLTGSSLYIGTASANTNVVFNNNATGTVTNSSYLYVYGNSTVILNNYGTFGGNGLLQQGNQTSSTGGTVNNYNNFTRNNGGAHYIHNGAVFNNYEDATATFAGQLHLGYQSGALTTYNQYVGTNPSVTKSTFNALIVNGYGVFNNNDKIVTNSTLNLSYSLSNIRLGEFNGNSGSTTQITSTSDIRGLMTIVEGANVSWGGMATVQIGSTTLPPKLLIEGTATGTTIRVASKGVLETGNNSSITLTGNPSIQLTYDYPFAEIAGDINAHSIHANGLTVNNLSNGYLCIGDYQGSYPSGSCNHVATSAVTLTGTNASSIYASPYSNVASSTVTIDIANETTMAGGLKARKGPATTSAIINIYKDALLTVNGRNAEACLGSQYCAIDVGADTNSAGSAEINVYGTVDLKTATGRIIGVGYNQSNTGPGMLNIKSDAVNGNGLIYDYTNSPLIISQYVGELNIERTDASNYGELYLTGGACTISSNSEGTDGNRGANIDGKLSCYGSLTVSTTGSVDVGRMNDDTDRGEVYVNGSTTTINNFVELDGLLDTGTDDGDSLTVTSTGHISSGVGEETNFEILAHDLTINSGGKISSDGVSEKSPGSVGGGSYGGAGEGRSASASYGAAKLGISDEPVYGEGGEDGSGLDAKGGGGVRIYSTGTITNNGRISADGAATANTNGGAGAGGTVILVHEPLAITDIISGSDYIAANGGNSSQSTSGAGGGGRVSIESVVLDDPDDGTFTEYTFDIRKVQALPGANSSSSDYAAAGTIVYTGDSNNSNDTLIVDQANNTTNAPGTEIPNSGDFIFDRVEARNGGEISYEADPVTDPVSCFEVGTGSDVDETYYTCNAYPDKPYELYINNSITGAQSGTEPSGASALSVGDLTPAFSIKIANPELTSQTYSKVEIEVRDDGADDIPYTGDDTIYWDASDTNNPVTLTTAKSDTQRTEDIEYAGDALSAGVTYYIRVRILDDSDNEGLWNHLDIGDHYKFEINNYLEIEAGCAGGAFAIKDAVNDYPNNNIKDVPTKRYGKGKCTMNFNSANTGSWQIKAGMASGETGFTDGGTNDIDPIPYTTDCDMDETGMTAEEKYGFNISNLTAGGGTIQNDSEQCNSTTYSFSVAEGKYHDVEAYSGEKIIAGTGTAMSKSFDLNMYANVSSSTAVTNYSIALITIITTDP